jgi:putative intracellular protease/amidase
MKLRLIAAIVGGGVLLAMLGGAGWIMSLPPAPQAIAAPLIPDEEVRATLAALKPPKRERPVIAIIGVNDATETTDYLMPAGILRRADVADVVLLATGPGAVKLYPALTVQPDATIAAFDARHPEGADYVIVPAMTRENDPQVLAWIKAQAGKGAIVIGVCVGAKIVANAGLLDGRRATTHWFSLDAMRKEHPAIVYAPDRRIVTDKGVATTTGITASMPFSLTLVEAIAGREKAASVARDLGLGDWDARHASGAFRFNRDFALTVIGNATMFWAKQDMGLELVPGMDEVSLALLADAWSRTYRSRALTFAGGERVSRNGVRIVPDRADWAADNRLTGMKHGAPARVLDMTLLDIAAQYGQPTADVVAMQLEYPRRR